MDYPLSGTEVLTIVNDPKIQCLRFGDIEKFGLGPLISNGKLLINYLTEPMMGHWCCLVKIGNTIFYFNPSGRFIDEALDFIPEKNNKLLNQDFPHLLKLLHDSEYKVRYVDKQMQESGTNSCGRWCALFLKFMPILKSEEKFMELFENFSNDDVIMLTDSILEFNRRLHKKYLNN